MNVIYVEDRINIITSKENDGYEIDRNKEIDIVSYGFCIHLS